MLKNRPFSL